MSSVDLNINNTTHYGIEEIYVPKADNSGDAIFVLSTNVVSHLDVNGIFKRNATNIDDIDNWITGSLPSKLFQNNSSLQYVNLPAVTYINSACFAGCANLTYANFPSCTSFQGEAFSGCRKLTEINAPLVTYLGDDCFRTNYALQSISFPSVTNIRRDVFHDCNALTSVYLPNCTTLWGNDIFLCPKLQEISLPKVTSMTGGCHFRSSGIRKFTFAALKNPEGAAFQYAYQAREFYLPSLTNINAGLFTNDSNIEKIVLSNTSMVTLQNTNAFSGTSIAKGTGYVYVPDELVNTYKAANNWSTYAAQIKGISELPQD